MEIQNISKKELSEFYKTHSNKETCQKFDISHTTLNSLLNKLKISKKGSGFKKVNIKE